MQKDFTIQEVYNPKATQDAKQNENLIFKVQWVNSKEIAFISFDLMKRRYSHVLLDYLTSKIQVKNTSQTEPMPVAEERHQKKGQKSPKISSPVTNEGNFEIEELLDPVSQFFKNCRREPPKNKKISVLDYDALVPLESNIGIAVFFRLKGAPIEGRKIFQVKKTY